MNKIKFWFAVSITRVWFKVMRWLRDDQPGMHASDE